MSNETELQSDFPEVSDEVVEEWGGVGGITSLLQLAAAEEELIPFLDAVPGTIRPYADDVVLDQEHPGLCEI